MHVRSAMAMARSGDAYGARRAWAWPAAGLLLALALLALLSDAPRYDIDFTPPDGKETYAEVLPSVIAGRQRTLQVMATGFADVHGARADYGGRALIDVVHAPSPGALDGYVRRSIEPRLAAYDRRTSGRESGAWVLQGRGRAGRFYAWQNRDWLFVIEAADEVAFDEAVDRFGYIRRE
jgi:hypothetical protein